ncbi:nucleotide exchange factor GrpE [Candidatus Bathyarchaeota archaeon]|nr:nucleotide exchange factor GrpE [Candidatus Bathyarchaeota archaeon]
MIFVFIILVNKTKKILTSQFFHSFQTTLARNLSERDFKMDKKASKKQQEQPTDVEEQINQERQKAQEYLKQLKYLQADFDNYRKRNERQIQELTTRCNEKLVTELLWFLDDLERALESGKKSADPSALLKGVEMIHKNLVRMLEKEGLERIDAVGKTFDPNIHELGTKIPRNDCEEGLVLDEVRKGFVYKGRVLRPCMVNISCIKEDEEKKDE